MTAEVPSVRSVLTIWLPASSIVLPLRLFVSVPVK